MSSDRHCRFDPLGWLAGTDVATRLDERERALLHEAYTVGFAVFMNLCFLLATAEIWVGGRALFWPSWCTLLLPVVPVLVVTRRNSVHGGPSLYSNRCLTPRERLVRAAPAVVLAVLWLAGCVRATGARLELSTVAGMATGAVVGIGLVLAATFLIRRASARRRSAEMAQWEDDDIFD